jgi:hypothetical protein
MEAELIDAKELDVPALIRGRGVALTGKLASMSREDFVELLDANGARYSGTIGRGTAVVVVGQRDWPVTRDGILPPVLRTARKLIRHEKSGLRVVSEDQFLEAMGLHAYRENRQSLYTLATLTQILDVSREQVRGWVGAGLIRPRKIEYGVWYFDFRQITAAKKLVELVRSGVPVRRLRLSFEQLRRWIPEAAEPLELLTAMEAKGRVLARLEDGDLIEPDGQLHLSFDRDHEAGSLKIMPGPRTAAEWFEQGVEQEQEGLAAEAVESYRQSLLIGGPEARTCFNLANVLASQGKRPHAVERYLQAVEIESSFTDAWNNLGLVLAEMNRPADACAAFHKVLAIDPHDLRAHYNLADTLEDMGRFSEAAEHWKAYLRSDQSSQWAAHARKRLAHA